MSFMRRLIKEGATFSESHKKAMKKIGVFVITARGGIVNEPELAIPLANNDILGAGGDVFW